MDETENNSIFDDDNNILNRADLKFLSLLQSINANNTTTIVVPKPRPVRSFNMGQLNLIVMIVAGLLVFSGLLAYCDSTRDSKTVVWLPEMGVIQGGETHTAWTRSKFQYYMGIPYAQSPSKELRFKPPVQRQPWHNVINGRNYGRRCPTHEYIQKLNPNKRLVDLEDCLNLCVYTKNKDGHYPVMVYIHGGGFINGSASDHPPQYLMEADIVLAVVQYRIGIFGFLSTQTAEIPGNMAVLDVIMALQWIQEYIVRFGGDPSQVTIFGQSAGAAIASLLTISPQVPENLFQRAIIQSGSILSPWAIDSGPPLSRAQVICKKCGCLDCINPAAINDCLINIPTIDLLKTLSTTPQPLQYSLTLNDFGGILPDLPKNLKFNKYPIMAGATKHDGSFATAFVYDVLSKSHYQIGNLDARRLIQLILNNFDKSDNTGIIGNLLTKLLFTSEELDNNNRTALIPGLIDLASIVLFKSPVLHYVDLNTRENQLKNYLYSFEYEGEYTRFGYEKGNNHYPFNGGVHHSNDNLYLFPYPCSRLNKMDLKMAKIMVQLWTTFAINGRPSADILNGTKLLPTQNGIGPYFKINQEITTGKDYLDEFLAATNDPDKNKLIRPITSNWW